MMARCDVTMKYKRAPQDASLVDIGAIEVQNHLAGGVAAAEARTGLVTQAERVSMHILGDLSMVGHVVDHEGRLRSGQGHG
jgi:hypothetical protein